MVDKFMFLKNEIIGAFHTVVEFRSHDEIFRYKRY